MKINQNNRTKQEQIQTRLTSIDNITNMHHSTYINKIVLNHFQSSTKVKQYHNHVIFVILSLLYLLSIISFVAPTTQTIPTKIIQPKTSLGYKCVRRNHQLFCPKPPINIHGQTRLVYS